MSTTVRLSIEDFERLPDALAKNHELVDGELIDVSGNTPRHNALRDLLIALLVPYVAERRLGKVIAEQEYDFGGNAHGPDVSLISLENLSLLDPDRRVQLFVPELAIEIVSRNDNYETLMTKVHRYRRCGTKEVWLLSPRTRDAQVDSETRHEVLNENGFFESPLIPGFSIRLGDLFDRA